MAARKKKTEETKKMENLEVTNVSKIQNKNKRIVLKKDTELRKYPTLQKEHIVAIAKAGTAYEIIDTIGGIYGWFYKLNNGSYVVKNGDYTIIS